MIALFDADGNRLAVTYNGLTLNSPSDDPDSTYELNTAGSNTQMTMISDDNPVGDGSEMYEARKISRLIRLDGVVRAQSLPELYDREKALAAAFDPAKISHENPGTDFLALDFSVPTESDAYPTGLVPSRYYARPRYAVELLDSSYTGFAKLFSIQMLMKDPRRYLQSESSAVGSTTADNTKADYRSYPTVTIAATGAGSSTFSIARACTGFTTKTLTLNLSGLSSGNTVTVDMGSMRIKKNGTDAQSLFVSGDYWEMEPGSNTITVTNGTNVTVTTTWRSAFCV